MHTPSLLYILFLLLFSLFVTFSFSFSWLIPTPVRFPREHLGAIYGYMVPAGGVGEGGEEDRDSELVPLTRADGSALDGGEGMESMPGEGERGVKVPFLRCAITVTVIISITCLCFLSLICIIFLQEKLLDHNHQDPSDTSVPFADVSNIHADIELSAGLGVLGKMVRSNSGSSNGSLSSVGDRDRETSREKGKSSHPSVRKRVNMSDPK